MLRKMSRVMLSGDSSVLSRSLTKAIENRLGEKGRYEVFVSPKAVSMAVGQKKCNTEYFKKQGFDIKITADKSIEKLFDIRIKQI